MLNAAINVAWFYMLKAKEYADSGGVDLSMIVRGCDLKLTYNGEKVGAWEKANELSLQFRKTKADQQSFGESKTVASTGVEGLCPVVAVQSLWEVAPQRFDEESEAAKLPSGGARYYIRWRDWRFRRCFRRQRWRKDYRQRGFKEPPRLFQATGEIETVKRAGRWTSLAVQRYLWDGGKTKDYSRRMAEASGLLHYTWPSSEGEFGGSEALYLIVEEFGDAAIYGGRGDAKVAQNGLGPTDTKVSTTGAACRQKGCGVSCKTLHRSWNSGISVTLGWVWSLDRASKKWAQGSLPPHPPPGSGDEK